MNEALICTEQETEELRRRLSAMEELERRCLEAEQALKAIEQRNRILGDSAPMGIVTVDRQGRIEGLTRRFREMLPWPREMDPMGANLFEFQPLVAAGVIEDFRQCLTSPQTIQRDYSCVDDHGRCLQLRFQLGTVTNPDGEVTGVMAFVEDATQLKLAQAAADENEQRYQLLFQSAPVAMVERDASQLKIYLEHLHTTGIHDLRTYFQENPDEIFRCLAMIKTADCNNAFLDLLETQDKDALLADLPRVVMGPEFQKMAGEIIIMVAQGCFIPEREMTIRTVLGREKRIMTRAMVLAGHEATLARVVISMVDISSRVAAETALRASEQRFREHALHDNLTGLYNQRYLHHSLPLLIQSAAAENSPLAVIFMDLDNFKRVVDTHGHLNGSRVIQEVAATVRRFLQPPAYAVAYAGDEFVFVLPDADEPHALEKALEIQNGIKTNIFLKSQNQEVQLNASFGIAVFPNHGEDAEALLAAADTALFQIKGTGKGAVGQYKASQI